MWLARRFLLRPFRLEPLRPVATVFGIALGIAVVVAIRLANASSIRGFETALEAMAGKTSLEISGPAGGIEETALEKLGWLRDFGSVSPIIEGDAIFRSADGRVELLRVLGVDILRDRPFREYDVLELSRRGRPPTSHELLELLLDARAVIVTGKFAQRYALRPGDELTVTIGDLTQRLVIRGLLLDRGPARALDGNVVVMDIAAAQWMFERLGRIDRLDLLLRNPGEADRDEKAILGRLPEGLIAQRPARRGQQVERMLAAFQLNLTALSMVALLVGVFLIYNTVSVSVVARREEIGMLRALGVTRRKVASLFLFEAVVLAVPGCILGVLLGRALASGAVWFTSTTVDVLYVPAVAVPAVGWVDAAVALVLGVTLSLVAAAAPSVEASRVSPIAAIRGADRLGSRTRSYRRSVVVALLFFASAAWLAVQKPVGGLPLAAFGAAVAVAFGAAFLVPTVLATLARFGRPLLVRLAGVEGLLANANLAGAVPRLSISIAALAVSLAMMVAVSVMVASFRYTVIYWIEQTLKADLYVAPASRGRGARHATVSPEVESVVRANPAVVAVDAVTVVPITYRDRSVLLSASDFDLMLERGHLLFKTAPRGRDAIRQAIGRDEVVVSEAFANRFDVSVGDTVRLPSRRGFAAFRVGAVFYDYSSDRGVIAMDRRTFLQRFGELRPTGLSVYLRSDADADSARAALTAAMPSGTEAHIYTNRSLRAEVLRIFDATFSITYALEVIAILVAIMGVAGTLVTLVLERGRELAVLRLVGADRRQVRRMVVLEALMMGGVSQSIGLGVGLVLSLLLVYVINVQSFGWTIQFRVPLSFLAQMSALILLATAFAGLVPANRATRLSIAAAVAEE